jgi:hypothetical protein
MEPEFAPRYSTKERRRRLLLHGVLCVLMFVAVFWWALPRLRSYFDTARCETIFGLPGSTVLVYGVFVGLPLAAAILIVLLTARTSLHAIATRRYPPPGRKVYGRVKVKKGWQAIAFALLPAMLITYLCVLSSQGMSKAAQIARETKQSATCGTQNVEVPTQPESSRSPAREGRRRRSSR